MASYGRFGNENSMKWVLLFHGFPSTPTNLSSDTNAMISMYVFCSFPSLPPLRNRGLYEQDLISRSVNRDTDTLREQETCKKTHKRHKSLLGGIFTVYCKCGECADTNSISETISGLR